MGCGRRGGVDGPEKRGGGLVCAGLAIWLLGAALHAHPSMAAEEKEGPPDATTIPDLPPDTTAIFEPPPILLGEPIPDSLRVPIIPGALSGERPARIPRESPPWMQLRAAGDTLFLGRDQVDRLGTHEPVDLLERLPGVHGAEAAFSTPIGALAIAGSFAWPDLSADGWILRAPRLEGRDLSRLLLDRLGPSTSYVPLSGLGDLRVVDAPAIGAESPSVRLAPASPVADSAQSRVGVETGGYGFAGAGITLADKMGRFAWGFGADNTRTGRTGSLDHAASRLTMMDMAWAADFARLAVSLRNAEVPSAYKDGRKTTHFDQGFALAMIAGDTLGPAWGLRLTGRDDRLSGTEFPEVELKRKGLLLEANGWPRPRRPVWWRASAEHDWFAVRHAGGAYEPRVDRVVGEAGGSFDLARLGPTDAGRGRVAFDVAGSLRVSDRHAPSAGGRGEVLVELQEAVVMGVGASRIQIAPTYDQEVLVPGNPEATPERHDSYSLRLTRTGAIACGLEGARREITHQPFVAENVSGQLWPQFRFVERTSRHWEVRGAISYKGGPLGFEAGVWGSRLFPDEESAASGFTGVGLAPFVPVGLGRAFASVRLSLFGEDLIILPRVEVLGVGDRNDFDGDRLPGYVRLDGALVGIVARDVDLELWARNLLNRRYDLAVIEPESGDPYVDSGRMAAFALRWRFLN